MTGLKVVTFWVRPRSDEVLPEAGGLLEGLLQVFYEAFPEYGDMLVFSQSPRPPRYVFVYTREACTGVLPEASRYLATLLEQAFPEAEVRSYGRPWPRV